MTKLPLYRFPLMALAGLSLIAALWAGLRRIGWMLPETHFALPVDHGPLMALGFLGTLIGVERAVAVGKNWAYAGPLLTGLGAVGLLAGLPPFLPALIITLGSVVVAVTVATVARRHPSMAMTVQVLGAAAWVAGNALWLAGGPVYVAAGWWGGFLVLTIAGERLELSRLLILAPRQRMEFFVAAALFLAGLILGLYNYDWGMRVTGAGMLALAAWLLRRDLALRTIRHPGLPRFVAVCLLLGFVWLAISGLGWLVFGGLMAGPRYDAVTHTLMLGFVFSMIFGHAPIIFPAILGRPLAFRKTIYLPLALLHLSLILRVASDLGGWWVNRALGEAIDGNWLTAQMVGGLLNAVAILSYFAHTAWSVEKAESAGS